MMHDIYSLVSIILFASPVVLGVGAYFALWFNEEFWKDSLYDYDEE